MPNKIPTHKKDINSDCYETPEYCWDLIKEYIPKDKVIWEPFYLNGSSGEKLKSLGFDVIHKEEDFFENDYDAVVVSNPPWSKNKQILQKLKQTNKQFILLVPINLISTKYFRDLFINEIDKITLFLFKKRVSFRPAENVKASSNYSVSVFIGYNICEKQIIYL